MYRGAICSLFPLRQVLSGYTDLTMSDFVTAPPSLTLSHREGKLAQVPVLFQRHEPPRIMMLLRANRRKLETALSRKPLEDETLIGLTKAICTLAETSARYAQVPTAPKPQLTGGKNIVRPILDIAGVTDA